MWLHQHPLNAVRTLKTTPYNQRSLVVAGFNGAAIRGLRRFRQHLGAIFRRPPLGCTSGFSGFGWMRLLNRGIHPANPVIFLDDLAVTEQTGDIQTSQEIFRKLGNPLVCPRFGRQSRRSSEKSAYQHRRVKTAALYASRRFQNGNSGTRKTLPADGNAPAPPRRPVYRDQ